MILTVAADRRVARIPNRAGNALTDALSSIKKSAKESTKSDQDQAKDLGHIEAGAIDKSTGTTLGTEAEGVVNRSSDNESKCARWVEGTAAKPGDYEACIAYWDALRTDPAGTINHTLSVYLVGEQEIGGALCSSVLATNPYGWIGCQVVGHILGERIGKALHNAFTADPKDCRGGRAGQEAFTKEIFAALAPFAVDEQSAKELLQAAQNEGSFQNTLLADCGRSRFAGYDEGALSALLDRRTDELRELGTAIHVAGMDRVMAAGRSYARRHGGVAGLRQYIEGRLLQGRRYAAEQSFILQNQARGGIGNAVASAPQAGLPALEKAWAASPQKAAIDAAEGQWVAANVPFSELDSTGPGWGTALVVLGAVGGVAYYFRKPLLALGRKAVARVKRAA